MNQAIYGQLPIIGNMIPKDYVVTKGFGDTNLGSGNKNPWQTGSFDMALVMAGIENFNIVKYTSILPPEATEIPIERARSLYRPGAVMGTILAQVNGVKGEHICAGIGKIEVKRNYDGLHIAGYAAEYMGNGNEQEAKRSLHESLINIVLRRYNPKDFSVFGEKFCIQDNTVKNKYGTVIAAIGFLTNIYPMLDWI
ncbi:pyruvoyl-dependent arginine decarboxylase [Desulfitobacterium sp. AusDCA]|uniref:pyruvoyl-dependent arginine decarboxylase n=1 Tax=Desulfitobacterium sp. AusDCA TaxID=3240383 RepID=UPI003DA6FD19